MLTLDLHAFGRRDRDLRAVAPSRQARFVAAITAEGQRMPFLVVSGESDRFTRIDGLARIAAPETLGRGTVEAVVQEVAEADARMLGHRLDPARRRTAFQEGWPLSALVEVHGMRARERSVAFGKPSSGVSRRLALVRVRPDSVQDAVWAGRRCVHGAETLLAPLARANAAQCAGWWSASGTQTSPSVSWGGCIRRGSRRIPRDGPGSPRVRCSTSRSPRPSCRLSPTRISFCWGTMRRTRAAADSSAGARGTAGCAACPRSAARSGWVRGRRGASPWRPSLGTPGQLRTSRGAEGGPGGAEHRGARSLRPARPPPRG